MADIRTEPSTSNASLADYRALDSSVSGQTHSNTGSNEVLSESASDVSSLKQQQSDGSHKSTSTVNTDEGIQMTRIPAGKQPQQSKNETDTIEVVSVEEDPLLSEKEEIVTLSGGDAETNLGGTSGWVAEPLHQVESIPERSDKTETTSTIATRMSTDSATTDTSNTCDLAQIVQIIVIVICLFVGAVLAVTLCLFFCGKVHGSSNNPSTNELKKNSSATDHIANMTDICLDWAMNATTNTTGKYNMTNIDWGRCANVTANITTSHSLENLAATNASETTTGPIEEDFN